MQLQLRPSQKQAARQETLPWREKGTAALSTGAKHCRLRRSSPHIPRRPFFQTSTTTPQPTTTVLSIWGLSHTHSRHAPDRYYHRGPPYTMYLLVYNAVNALLWLSLFGSILATPSLAALYPAVEPLARWTQTLSIAEILHAALGLTRAPVSTTFTQIFTRCVQVWVVNHGYPELYTGSSTEGQRRVAVYAAMLLAWSVADIVRYTYFVVLLGGKRARVAVPTGLVWLRYSLFFVLYPVGIGAEWWLMLSAARVSSATAAAVYYFCLLLYVPGAIMMYSYMVKQRRKTLSAR